MGAMSESDLADRFTRDVDILLLDGGGMDVEPAPPEYRADIQVARALAAADRALHLQAAQRVAHRRPADAERLG